MMGGWEAHMISMNVDQADLKGLSSQGKSQNTANFVTIDS